MTNLERLRLAPNELNDAVSASSQALAHEAVAHGLPALIKAMMRNVDGDFVESGLDVLSATCVDLEAPRFHAAYRAGAPRYVQALLLRLALDQYLCGPNTPDTKRDRMARRRDMPRGTAAPPNPRTWRSGHPNQTPRSRRRRSSSSP